MYFIFNPNEELTEPQQTKDPKSDLVCVRMEAVVRGDTQNTLASSGGRAENREETQFRVS